MESTKQYLPLMLDVTDRNILLIGAGRACAEKLRTLAQLGKTIRVIAPEIEPEFLNKEWIQIERRTFRTGDLRGFDIVYAGINDPVEEQKILAEARTLNLLINFVDEPALSDFISVSALIRKWFTIFISTYGKGPGMTKRIRQMLEEKLDLDALDREAGEYIRKR